MIGGHQNIEIKMEMAREKKYRKWQEKSEAKLFNKIILFIHTININKGQQCNVLREHVHPISQKTPAPKYQPIERKKGKNGSRQKGNGADYDNQMVSTYS